MFLNHQLQKFFSGKKCLQCFYVILYFTTSCLLAEYLQNDLEKQNVFNINCSKKLPTVIACNIVMKHLSHRNMMLTNWGFLTRKEVAPLFVCQLICHNSMSSFNCFQNVLDFQCSKTLITVIGCDIVMKLLNSRNMLLTYYSFFRTRKSE